MCLLVLCCFWLLKELQTCPKQDSELRTKPVTLQERTWRPCDPGVIITEGAKQKFREISRRSGKCGCACVKEISCSLLREVFYPEAVQSTVHKCFAITWGFEIVFYCFVSLQVPHLQNYLFEHLRWQIYFTSDLQMKHLLWVGNDQYFALTSFQKSSVPTYFFVSATEGYSHKSAHSEGYVLCC